MSDVYLTLGDLKEYFYDKVCVYTSNVDDCVEFCDVYSGDIQNIPDELLKYGIRSFGAKRRGVLDVCIHFPNGN